ncbi:hypothetical protein GMMP15_1030083 [Candidatus Magnetomoraceae bacterium gMMP-15]
MIGSYWVLLYERFLVIDKPSSIIKYYFVKRLVQPNLLF